MLATGFESLVLADGTVINPDNGAIVREQPITVEVPNNEEIQREIVVARTRIAELPAPSEQMNTISVILCYTMYGVSNDDIATLVKLPVESVQRVKMSDVYKEVQTSFINNIIASDKSEVRDMFVEQSKHAATRMTTLMSSDSEAIQMSAAKDILDRAGQRPVDVVEHRHKVEGGLTIEYKKQETDFPTIDVTPNG
jgi:hypothetical protein